MQYHNGLQVRTAAVIVERLTQIPAVLAAALGLVALAGWAFDLPVLKSVLPDSAEIKFNTAVALVLAGCALFILGRPPSWRLERLALVLAMAVAALGTATLAQYVFDLDLRIDEVFFRDTATIYNEFPGRMSPYSAVAFASIGIGLSVFPRRRMRPLVWIAAIAVTMFGVAALLGYAWNASAVVGDRRLLTVALHTSIGFVLLGGGTLLALQAPVWQRALKHSRVPASVETKILYGFVGALVLLFVAGGFAYRTNAQLANTSRWLAHTQLVRAALSELYATISDAEAAQRDYLLTGNLEYKDDYRRFASMVRGNEERLAALVADNAAQIRNFAELHPLIVKRMTALDGHISIFDSSTMAAVQAAIVADDGIRAKRKISILIDRMDDTEKDLLADRAAILEYDRVLTLVTLLVTLAVATIILTTLYLGIRRQIAARAEAEHALVAAKETAVSASRAKSTFLATMSHEIRTPMNGMLGMLELLTLTRLDTEQRTTLEIVRQSSKSLLRIIDDILDFSKIEAGKLDLRHEVASIKDVIEDVHNIYSGNASSKGLLIKRIADPKISPAVLVDPLRLRQVLNNLVSNALKFTSKGSIEIRAELIERANGEDRIRFSVTDTGIGISPENQQRLFQPFHQGDDDATRRVGGTGLGLTICRRLAEMMGGSVEMESELGRGTTMTLIMSLPIADPKDLPKIDLESARDLLNTASGMRRIAPSVDEAALEGTLALLVDDHPTNRTLLMRQVHALGYAAEIAENGLEALDKWKSGRFGIIITDCNMPNMDGYELARRIRVLEAADGGGKHIPIVACTANALAGESEVCFAAGMDDYLVKPVELPQILKKLELWLPIPPAGPGENPGKEAAPAPVDRSALAAISGGDLATERDILMDFRRVNDEDAVMLEQAVSTRDIPQVTRATHRILGACRMVGALGLADVCERLERASRASDWTTITAGMEAFHHEWILLNTYFETL